jgi:hypothetical protein
MYADNILALKRDKYNKVTASKKCFTAEVFMFLYVYENQ